MVGEAQSVSTVTPSGIEVLYQWEPKRLYRVREYYDGATEGENDWTDVPSVTEVLSTLDKPGLPYWGNKIGVEGVLALVERGELRIRAGILVHPDGTPATQESVMALLVKYKLTVNHVRDKAGDRGTAVHDALEQWARFGTLPSFADFSLEEQGYVKGLASFLKDVPTAVPVAAEVMVGSVEHGYAGRYDLRFSTHEEHMVVYHRTPKKGPNYAALAPGRYLLDLKTSKGVYPTSHYRQLAAYEGASVECGYPATDGQGILNVSADGTYKLVRSSASQQDFLDVLAVWRGNQQLKGK